ncbi:hypothetical protein NDU88_005063 [Pleurodeles waltl]|uniref:Uncharacterized protein n=1 Tax=Pleurodeles waltl TaxID=8319 RepID=A0AAV7T9L6_PLEWA|nr:hypothetical protein NDU88_005063 [Pleurodeles waltl]
MVSPDGGGGVSRKREPNPCIAVKVGNVRATNPLEFRILALRAGAKKEENKGKGGKKEKEEQHLYIGVGKDIKSTPTLRSVVVMDTP